MDILRRRKSTPASSSNNASPLLEGEGRTKKKDRGTSDKAKKSIFSFSKSKVKDSSDGGKSKVKNLAMKESSASPQPHRKLVQKHNSSLDDSLLETSCPAVITP
jgi:hypothetical protein